MKILAGHEAWPSLPAMFFDHAETRLEAPLFFRKIGGLWTAYPWRWVEDEILRVAGGLAALGIGPGDRVALVAESRPEWVVAHFAAMSLGAISVPGYITHQTPDYRHLLADSGAKLVIVSSAALLARVRPAAEGLGHVAAIVAIDAPAEPGAVPVIAWSDLAGEIDLDARVSALRPDDVACLIYTSGTGGVPKGAMLTHRNILSNCHGAAHALASVMDDRVTGEPEIFLSFLPLNHAYEHTGGLMLPLAIGAQIYFSAGAENLTAELREVRPTIMTAVPRLFELMHRRIRNAARSQGRVARLLFEAAIRTGRQRYVAGSERGRLDPLIDLLCEVAVRRKVRRRFGGRLKVLVSGGAPLSEEIGLFFLSLGVKVMQGYGQTETAPVVAVNTPDDPRADTVGPPMRDTELAFAEDGEILVRGPMVMKGYWNDPEATARTIRDGWLHTGDIGRLTPEGHLQITDRKRDFIKTSGGEMVAPQRIEGLLTLQEGVAQAMVLGDNRPYLAALLVPDDTLLRAEGGAAAIERAMANAVAAVNRTLPPAERVRRFLVLDQPFSLANGQLTPTLKTRRNAVRAAYDREIEALYGREEAA